MKQFVYLTSNNLGITSSMLELAKEYLLDEQNYRSTISIIEEALVYPLDNLKRVNNSVFATQRMYDYFIQLFYDSGYYIRNSLYDTSVCAHIYRDKKTRQQTAIVNFYKRYYKDHDQIVDSFNKWASKIDLYYSKKIKTRADLIPVGEFFSIRCSVAVLTIIRYYCSKCPLSLFYFPKEQIKRVKLDDIIQYYICVFGGKKIIQNPQYLLCSLLESGIITDKEIDTFNSKFQKYATSTKQPIISCISSNNSFCSLIQKMNDEALKSAIKYINNKVCNEWELASTNLISCFSNEFLLDIGKMDTLKNLFLFWDNEENVYSSEHSQGLKHLKDFSTVLQKRYSINEYPKEITWHLFCQAVIKYYSKKWLSISTVGEIGEYSIEEYINLCFSNDLLPIGDVNNEMILVYYILSTNHSKTYTNFNPKICLDIKSTISELRKDNKISTFEKNLFSRNNNLETVYTIDDIDLMNGLEFEEFLATLFVKMGYSAKLTKSTGDQGIDVVAERKGIKYGIQAKCYAGNVGNSAVQEAVAGKSFYNVDKVIVITNSHFTESAIILAKSNGVILWDREILSEKLHFMNK